MTKKKIHIDPNDLLTAILLLTGIFLIILKF